MRVLQILFVLGFGIWITGCATIPTEERVDEDQAVDPDTLLAERADAVREAGGFVAVQEASSLTMPTAQDRALRRAREELAESVVARVEALQDAYLEGADPSDPEPVVHWFAEVQRYLQELIAGGARPAVEKQVAEEGLSTVWILVLENPGAIVQAMEIRAAADRQLFELVRSSRAYRELLAEAESFAAYRDVQDWID